MKKTYSKPEFEKIEVTVKYDVLTVSDPEPTIATGGGGANPEFGDNW